MNIVNASNYRKDMFRYMESTIKFNEPVNVTLKMGDVVVMSGEDYRGLMETRYIESIPGLKEKILAGDKEKGVELDWRKRLGE